MKRRAIIILGAGLAFRLLYAPAAFADAPAYHVEKDLLGEKQIPATAYYGV